MTIAVKRALSLLDLFSESSPEIGLSDAARLSGHDKATVHRLLNTLREAELVEQDATTKLYRLGPAVLRLARVREKSVPLVSVVQPLLDRLTAVTGETSHLALYSSNAMVVIAASQSPRPNHVSLRQSERLPMNATASGQAFLAFAAPEILAHVLAQPLQTFTLNTAATAESLQAAVMQARTSGFAVVDKSYDDDVFGIAVPVFGSSNTAAIGALAVASPRHRMTETAKALIMTELEATAREITRRLGN
jgi:IclR family transcriptional regulator, acetate operon repressor